MLAISTFLVLSFICKATCASYRETSPQDVIYINNNWQMREFLEKVANLSNIPQYSEYERYLRIADLRDEVQPRILLQR